MSLYRLYCPGHSFALFRRPRPAYLPNMNTPEVQRWAKFGPAAGASQLHVPLARGILGFLQQRQVPRRNRLLH